MRLGRVLGIDAGERRIGLALSDEMRLLASPLTVLDRGHGLAPVLDALTELTRREGVVQVVVGLPLNADGTEGKQARRARDFARVTERVVGLPVTMWDERLSTREAESLLRAQGRNMKRLRQAGQIDAYAAAVILQDYLDHSPATRGSNMRRADSSGAATDAPTAASDLQTGGVRTLVADAPEVGECACLGDDPRAEEARTRDPRDGED